MAFFSNRRAFLGILASAFAWLVAPALGQATKPGEGMPGGRGRRPKTDAYALPQDLADFGVLSLVLGRASDRAVSVSALARDSMEGYFELGMATGNYCRKTKAMALPAGEPVEVVLDELRPDTEYFYRLQWRKPGDAAFAPRTECRFHTQRGVGSTFTFAIQGDSHPERPQMSDPALYARTLGRVAESRPDFYICMGDDFSIEKLQMYTADTVAGRYTLQRPFLGLVAQSAALFLLNGNHEQASSYNFNRAGMEHDAAVWAQTARNRYFPMPAPDGFYTGDTETFKGIGLLRDYYAWTWGDALFVVLDNYWHSPACVDTQLNGDKQVGGKPDGHQDRDWWGITLGDVQYQWLKKTLEESKARHKFVFAHHVLGSGRGGVDESGLYEWGGKNKRGDSDFKQKRPGWDLPVHALMVKHGVSVFFQGHDHLYARQERDGVVYQEVPMPADQGYVAYNEDRYGSGTKLPNSGYLRVTVSPEDVKVEYVRCYLPQDENDKRKTGEIAHSYAVKAKVSHG